MRTKTNIKNGSVIHDLLTENRLWTFWNSEWSEHIYIQWNGKTKFKTIINKMKKKLGDDIFFERQVSIENPNLIFK